MGCTGCGSRSVSPAAAQPAPDLAAIAAETGMVRMVYNGHHIAPISWWTPVTKTQIQVQNGREVLVDPRDATYMRSNGLFSVVQDPTAALQQVVASTQPSAVPGALPNRGIPDAVPFASAGAVPRQMTPGRITPNAPEPATMEGIRKLAQPGVQSPIPRAATPTQSIPAAPDGGPPLDGANKTPVVAQEEPVEIGVKVLTEIPGIGPKLAERMSNLGIDHPDDILGWDDNELSGLLPSVSPKTVRKWKEYIIGERDK